MMYLQHFGLKYAPFGKNSPFLNLHESNSLKERFYHLLHSPGIGLLTGEPGVGKTAALRSLVKELNPHQYQAFYLAETQFTSFDIYRQMAMILGLNPAYRFAQLWRDIKALIREQSEAKQTLPIFIIDEAQNLPLDFFRGFPSFLNFDFDSKAIMTVWFVGHPSLASILKRPTFAALASRIHAQCQLKPILERERFAQLLDQAFKEAGSHSKLISDSGVDLVYMASKGRLRQTHRLLVCAMQIASQKGIPHITDELIQEAISQLKE